MRLLRHRGVALATLAALALQTGCATVLRSDPKVRLLNAPPDLQVLERGTPLPVEDEGVNKVAHVGWRTREVTFRTGGRDHRVELDTNLGLGWLVADYLLFAFPILVDLATSKWTNFNDMHVPTVLAKAGAPSPAQPALVAAPARRAEDVKADARHAEDQRRAEEQRRAPEQPLVSPATRANGGAAVARTPVVSRGKLAVLEFKSYTDALKPEDVRYFSDVVRGATLRAAPGLDVMTRENLLVLLKASGKDLANCEGECEVDTGRRIGADVVVSGDLLKVGSRFKLSLRLHETHDGRLLSTAVASGKTIDELDESAQTAAQDLLLR